MGHFPLQPFYHSGRAMSNISNIRPVTQPCPLPLGSRVALRGGGMVMTVIEEYEPLGNSNQWFVQTAWHNDVGDTCYDDYPVAALYEVEDEVEGRAVAFKVAAL